MVKILNARLQPLDCKHYDTSIHIDLEDDMGQEHYMTISISGYYSKPSERELDRGWEPDWGMDHVESEAHLELANKIMEALQR
jgi:hypothetical protein